jgi:GAF domain-containing protein
MRALRAALAGSPRALLQKLTEVALELCAAQSAGVSLLEPVVEPPRFRWYATAGAFAPLLWTTLPRHFSPCGTVLDRGAVQLMVDPARHFTHLSAISPRVVEALLVPFAMGGTLVGTVWVVAHDDQRHFDDEDRRVVAQLTRFAATAYERLVSMKPDDVQALLRMQRSEVED